MGNEGGNSGFWRRAVPYVKPKLRGDEPGTVTLSHEDSPVLRELNDDLLVLYVVDEGDHFAYVQNRHLPNGVGQSELHAVALANLEALADGKIRLQPHGPIFALFLDGNFEASLLLLDWLWQDSLREYAPHGPVAAVPSRDVLAFCDRNDIDGLTELTAVIARVFPSGGHTISASLFQRASSGWVRHDA